MAIKEYLTIFPSGTRTASEDSQDYSTDYARGLVATVSVSSIAAGALTVKVQGKDRISGTYWDILASAPILASTDRQLRVYPGLTASTNLTVSDVLPETWRISVVAASGTASYSIGASLIP